MTVMTHMSDAAIKAQEQARNRDGTFGEQVRSAPEASLSTPSPENVYDEGDVEYGSDERPYPSLKGSDRIRMTCGKCGGTGVYNAPSSVSFYTASVRDITTGCFECMGTGSSTRKVSSIRARARRERKVAAETKAFNERQKAAREAWVSKGYDQLLEEIRSLADSLYGNDPRYYPAHRLADAVNIFTVSDEIAAEARAMVEEEKARLKRPSPIPEGRATVRVKFISSEPSQTQFGTVMKMTVELKGGGRVYGTYPNKLYANRGDVFELTATFERSRSDPDFGFFKNPRVGEIINRAESHE